MKSRTVFALVCCLLAIQLVSARQNTQQEKSSEKVYGSISGRVTIQGKPAADVELFLFREKENSTDREKVTVKTGKDGRYKFDNLPAYHYSLEVLTEEYVNAGDTYERPVGIDVSLTKSEAIQDADIALISGGIVSGQVLNMDGKPVAGIPVEVFRPDGRQVYFASRNSQGTTTDSQGKFRITGITPETYLVGQGVDVERMQGKVRDRYDISPIGNIGSDSYYERSYFPDGQDITKAKPIQVTSGAEIKGISIRVGKNLKAYSVNGQIMDEEGNPVKNYGFTICRRTPNGGYRTSINSQTDANGYFFIKGFLSGNYFIGEGFRDAIFQFTNIDFEIKNNDLSGVYVKAARGYSVGGKFVLEGNTNPEVQAMIPQLKLRAMNVPDWNNKSSVQWKETTVNNDGTFRIGGFRSGNFEISITGTRVSQYFAITRIEYPISEDKQQSQILLPENRGDVLLSIENNNLTDAKIFLRYKNGTIKCKVNFINGLRPPGTHLYASLRHEGSITAPTIDANGEFVEDGLDDGDYTLEIGDETERFKETKIVKIIANSVVNVTFDFDVKKNRKTK